MTDLKEMTNVEFITKIAEENQYGVLSQAFIIQALFYYCDSVLAKGEPEDDGFSFVSPILWYDLAKDIKNQLSSKYES